MISESYLIMEHWCMIGFGKNLSTLRKTRSLTQIELAEFLEVQPRLVGRWEQGKGKPQFDYLLKLADVLEVSLDRLLRGNDDEHPDSFDIKNRRLKELCKMADRLKKEDQDVICHFLDMTIRTDKVKQAIM